MMMHARILVVGSDSLPLIALPGQLECELRNSTLDEAGSVLKSWTTDICIIKNESNNHLIRLGDLKSVAPETSFVISAETISEAHATSAIDAGVEDCFVGPISAADMTFRILGLMKIRRLRENLESALTKLAREKTVLSRYFSEDIVDQILHEEISPELGGARMHASMFFFDIRNSTGIAEGLEPDALARLLSTTFADIMDLAFTNHGTVNKFTGDGMLVTFGCPVPHQDDAIRCVTTALAIRNWMETYNQFLPEELSEPLGFGIGISSGPVFAGNIGSFRRMEYSILGDAVNSASRIQDLTKKLKTDILLDGPTNELVKHKFQTKKLGTVVLRGRHDRTSIYTLLDTV